MPQCLEDALLSTFLPICDGTSVSLPGKGQCSASTRNEVFRPGADELTAMRLRLLKNPCLRGCKDAAAVAASNLARWKLDLQQS